MTSACCYEATAICFNSHSGSEERRRYIGMFKIKSNQSKDTAAARRECQHKDTPVEWLSRANPETIKLSPCGHVMGVKDALIQEAILTATAMADDGPPCRGGPWSHSNIGASGREEIKKIRGLASRAPTPAEARAAVGKYAAERPEASFLRMHCESKRFRSDSAEDLMGEYKRRRASTSGSSLSGCMKRYSRGLVPGTETWEESKWASDWRANNSKSLAMRKR